MGSSGREHRCLQGADGLESADRRENLDQLLGPRPPQGVDRPYYDGVTAAIDQAVVTPERDLGMELDLGLP